MSFKYNAPTLTTLESIFKENHYVIRYEKGRFQSGYCILQDKKVVIVNKFFETEARINALIDILQQIEVDPAVLDDKQKKLFEQLSQQKMELD
ncbi:MAG: hypothetical protein JWN78_330 [Bacteroidota bacterium]|nr:hypothetical protein [Bacteroidota bacterium]